VLEPASLHTYHWSKNKSTEEALNDFIGSQELSASGADDSDRKARISMAKLDEIIFALKNYSTEKLK